MRVMGQNSSTHSVSRELGTLSKWVQKFKQEESSVFGQEDAEVKKLRAKVKRLQDERDILKKSRQLLCKTRRVKFEFIFDHKHRWSISLMCEVLQVSRSGYYHWLPLREKLTEKQNRLNSAVLESWIDSHKLYGSRRIAKDVKSERDISLSKNTISSIMKRLHIASSYQRKKFRKPYKRGEITSYPSKDIKSGIDKQNKFRKTQFR